MDSPLFYQKWPLRPEPPPPDSLWESFFSFLRRVSVVWVKMSERYVRFSPSAVT